MKNIQIVDGAINATYSIFQATEAEFRTISPRDGQDMEFAVTAARRLGVKTAAKIFNPIWERPIAKQAVRGIHGTLFYNMEGKRKHFPRSMRERDWGPSAFNEAQRRLLGLSSKPAKSK